jgi:superfamily II DNA/RNA helicase
MTKFSDLKLDPKVLKAIEGAGYDTPTPIQAGAIPPALEGRDVLGIAQTGTGKTASFTLPMITMLAKGRARARMPRSLVLAPTRELAAQVAENFDVYAKGTRLTKALLIGGVSFKEQDQLIDRGVDVLIATPGRLLDHFERGKLLLTGVQIMVVDEADRMLDMGFIPDIERIFSLTPFTRQTLFFSATMAPEIERITNTFLSAPVKVEVARAATTSETIEQAVVMVKPSRKDRTAKEKRDVLRTLIENEGEACSNAIIFCNRKVDVDIVAKSLQKHGYNAEPIHGDLDQKKRMDVLAGFREGKIRFLCASDVAARGLDVPSVSHVFNFDVPSHAEDYVHRIGRTGRAGRSGKAFTICSTQDERNLADVEKLVEREIPRVPNPAASAPVAAPVEKKAQTAETPAPATDEAVTERPKRTRRRRGGAKSAANEATTTAPVNDDGATPSAPAVETPTVAVAEAAKPVEPVVQQPVAAEPAKAAKPAKEKPANQRGGRGRDNRVVGMGDHLPGFIAKSFDERRAG